MTHAIQAAITAGLWSTFFVAASIAAAIGESWDAPHLAKLWSAIVAMCLFIAASTMSAYFWA